MAPPQGGAFDFERPNVTLRLARLNSRLSLAKSDFNIVLKPALTLSVGYRGNGPRWLCR
jgi:hypothetical protein